MLYQHFSELCSLSGEDRERYLSNPELSEELCLQLRSLLADDCYQFTQLFDDGLSLSASAVEPESWLGLQVGKFRICELIGHGGMGAVYRGQRLDGDFDQQVAIKLVPAGLFRVDAETFINHEAQSLARLNHSHIVPLLDAGRAADGMVYMVMRLIEGAPLQQWLATQHTSTLTQLKLFLKLLDAVAHAHGHQVIHQDIKPSNILVDCNSEPYLVDFGISRLMGDHGSEASRAYLRALSCNFASPEQMQGKSAATHTDVFSLGKVLCFLLAGYQGSDHQEFQLHLQQASICSGLKAIIRMATNSEPEQRYPSVAQFKDDVQAYLKGQPLRAQVPLLFRFKSFCIRQRWSIAAGVIAITALVFGTDLHYQNQYKTMAAEQQAQLAEQQAQQHLMRTEMMLAALDTPHMNEYERQKVLIEAAATIDFSQLPKTQHARLLTALALSYRILGDYDSYQKTAMRLLSLAEGTATASLLVAHKMLAEHALLDMNGVALKHHLNQLDGLFRQVDVIDARALEIIMDWEFDNTWVTTHTRRWLEPFFSAGNAPQLTTLGQIHKHRLQALWAEFDGNYQQALELAEQAYRLTRLQQEGIPLRIFLRQQRLQFSYAFTANGNVSTEQALDEEARLLDAMLVQWGEQHPILAWFAVAIDVDPERVNQRTRNYLDSLAERMKGDTIPKYVRTSYFMGQLHSPDGLSPVQITQVWRTLGQLTGFPTDDQFVPLFLWDGQLLVNHLWFLGETKATPVLFEALASVASQRGNDYVAANHLKRSCQLADNAERALQICSRAIAEVRRATAIGSDPDVTTHTIALSKYFELGLEIAQVQQQLLVSLSDQALPYYRFKAFEVLGDVTFDADSNKALAFYRDALAALPEDDRDYDIGSFRLTAKLLLAEGREQAAKSMLTSGTEEVCAGRTYGAVEVVALRRLHQQLFDDDSACNKAPKWHEFVTPADEAMIDAWLESSREWAQQQKAPVNGASRHGSI